MVGTILKQANSCLSIYCSLHHFEFFCYVNFPKLQKTLAEVYSKISIFKHGSAIVYYLLFNSKFTS